jgi:hypothetical protein
MTRPSVSGASESRTAVQLSAMTSASQMTMHSGSSCAQDRRRGGRNGAKEGPTEPGGGDDGDSGDIRPVDDSGERTECGMAASGVQCASAWMRRAESTPLAALLREDEHKPQL